MSTSKYFVRSEKPIILVTFECDGCIEDREKCSNIIRVDSIEIPFPDCMIDGENEYSSYDSENVTCDKCGKNFDIKVNVSRTDVYVEIPELDNNNKIKIEKANDVYYQKLEEYHKCFSNLIESYLLYNDDSFIDLAQLDSLGSDYFIDFLENIKNLRKLNNLDLKNDSLEKTLKKLIYANIITCLEYYLFIVLIKKVNQDDNLLIKIQETHKIIKNKEKYQVELKEKIKTQLEYFLYYKLEKVKGFYKTIFEVEIQEDISISDMIKKRHIIVHKNGKDNQGGELLLDTNDVNKAIDKVEKFVREIDSLIFDTIPL